MKFKRLRKQTHPFHIVNPSPWPLFTALSVLYTIFGFVMFLHFYQKGLFLFSFGLLCLTCCILCWVRDVVREATFEGNHTRLVRQGLRLGFIIFIVSEVMLFFAFFWAFFHLSLNPASAIGQVWPPKGIYPLAPSKVPFFNTWVLLSSGAAITWAHHSVISGSRTRAIKSLFATIVLAILFTLLQYYEYCHAEFTISDTAFGSCFYMITGLHGSHVIIGTILLIGNFVRLVNHHFTTEQHVGLESAIWYWHFVDVVWLFVFAFVYSWAI